MRNISALTILIIALFSCKRYQTNNEFVTHYIEEGEHEIKFNSHFIYLDTVFNRDKDSLALIEKVIQYVDTVKAGKPVISVSIVNKDFPQSPDDINWQGVSKSTIFYVRFDEDSLKKGRNIVYEVAWHSKY